mgnify:FL=1
MIVLSDLDTVCLDCVTGSGNTVIKAIEVLQEHGVSVENVLLVSLFCTPYGESYQLKKG